MSLHMLLHARGGATAGLASMGWLWDVDGSICCENIRG